MSQHGWHFCVYILEASIPFCHDTIFNNYVILPVNELSPKILVCTCVCFFQHPKTLSLESLAVIIAQLLSLSIGIAYDDIDKCQCSGAVCIMNPEAM